MKVKKTSIPADSHLDAYMSVCFREKGGVRTATVTTLVKYNRKLGNFYFFFMRPFHKVIARTGLKRAIKLKCV